MVNCNNSTSVSPIFFCFTCVKNGEQYIKKLFDSLISQTKKNFIHYIYDDGSSKPMYDLINEYKRKVSSLVNPFKIIYEYNPINIGLNMATKYCISKVNLPYFIWINCDDWVDDDFFEEAEKYINKYNNFPIYYCNFIYHSNNKTVTILKNSNVKCHIKQKSLYYSFAGGCINFSCFFVNTEQYFKVNPNNYLLNDKKVFNDFQVVSFFASRYYNFGFIKNAVFHHLLREDSECSKNFDSISYEALMLPSLIGFNNKKFIQLTYEIAVFYDLFNKEFNRQNYKQAFEIFLMRNKYIKRFNLSKKFFCLRNHKNYVWFLYLFYCLIKSKVTSIYLKKNN